MELEPEAASPIEAPRGTITADTTIFTDGDPLSDNELHENDGVIGYDDIGGGRGRSRTAHRRGPPLSGTWLLPLPLPLPPPPPS